MAADKLHISNQNWRRLQLDEPGDKMISDPAQQGLYLRLRKNKRGQDFADWALRFRPLSNKSNDKVAPVTLKLGSRADFTLTEVRVKAAELLRLVAQGLDPRHIREQQIDEADARIVSKLIEEYLGDMRRRGVVNADSINRTLAAKFADWMNRDIASITRAEWAQLSASLAKDARQRVNRFLKFCLQEGHLSVNPFDITKRERRTRAEMLEAQRKRGELQMGGSGRALTDDELCRIWAATSDAADPFCRLTRSQMLSGCRRGELAQARYEWVSGAWLILPPEVTKMGRAHRVFITPSLRSVLQLDGSNKTGLIFPSLRGPRVQTEQAQVPMSGWSQLQAKLNSATDIQDLRSHLFRKTLTTRMLEKGETREAVRALLGQKVAQDALDTAYDHRSFTGVQERLALEWEAHVKAVTKTARLKVVA